MLRTCTVIFPHQYVHLRRPMIFVGLPPRDFARCHLGRQGRAGGRGRRKLAGEGGLPVTWHPWPRFRARAPSVPPPFSQCHFLFGAIFDSVFCVTRDLSHWLRRSDIWRFRSRPHSVCWRILFFFFFFPNVCSMFLMPLIFMSSRALSIPATAKRDTGTGRWAAKTTRPRLDAA